VSTDLQQKEGTIESQVVTLRRRIMAAGQELVREYIDDGYTGTLLARPGLEQLRADLKTELFDVVHFIAADRIARRAAYQSIIIEELIKAGKQIIINGTGYRNDPEGKVTLGILGVVSEFERAKIIERTVSRRALIEANPHDALLGLALSHTINSLMSRAGMAFLAKRNPGLATSGEIGAKSVNTLYGSE
jgi:DNA invertase Pin-like site-specific DNA recombinase